MLPGAAHTRAPTDAASACGGCRQLATQCAAAREECGGLRAQLQGMQANQAAVQQQCAALAQQLARMQRAMGSFASAWTAEPHMLAGEEQQGALVGAVACDRDQLHMANPSSGGPADALPRLALATGVAGLRCARPVLHSRTAWRLSGLPFPGWALL